MIAARTEVAHDVGDGPLGRVGRRDVLALVDPLDDRLQDGRRRVRGRQGRVVMGLCFRRRADPEAYCSTTTVRSRSRTSFTPVSPSVTIISDWMIRRTWSTPRSPRAATA